MVGCRSFADAETCAVCSVNWDAIITPYIYGDELLLNSDWRLEVVSWAAEHSRPLRVSYTSARKYKAPLFCLPRCCTLYQRQQWRHLTFRTISILQGHWNRPFCYDLLSKNSRTECLRRQECCWMETQTQGDDQKDAPNIWIVMPNTEERYLHLIAF